MTYPMGRVAVAQGETKDEVLTKVRKILAENEGFACLKLSVEIKRPYRPRWANA